MNSGNINTLPKWAQEEIKLLTMRLKEANDKLDLIYRNEPSNVTLVDIEKNRPLLPNSIIRFSLDSRRSIDVRIREEKLYMNAAFGRLIIIPEAANCVELDVEK